LAAPPKTGIFEANLSKYKSFISPKNHQKQYISFIGVLTSDASTNDLPCFFQIKKATSKRGDSQTHDSTDTTLKSAEKVKMEITGSNLLLQPNKEPHLKNGSGGRK
jgi:hypothetical protein